MQRVAYAQPVDGKVTVLAEYFITGQRIVQIAELDKEGFSQGFVREALQHIAKDSFAVERFIEIFSDEGIGTMFTK